jgi:hypothetical protein
MMMTGKARSSVVQMEFHAEMTAATYLYRQGLDVYLPS